MFAWGSWNKDYVQLGKKRIEVPKLTRTRMKKLTEHIGTIGDFLVKMYLTPEQDRATFLVAGADVPIDVIYELTSILSELPIEYLDEKASFAECVNFLKLTWEKNDMGRAIGNLNAMIPPLSQQILKSLLVRANQDGASIKG